MTADLRVVADEPLACPRCGEHPVGVYYGPCAACVDDLKSKFGREAPMISAYTGRRAEHVISGAIMIVASRSRQLVMVRAAMIPGTAHAKLDSSGMNDRPDRPTVPIKRSSRKAARGR